MSRILITGADSFTGRRLSATLHEAGHEIHGLVREPIGNTVANVHELHVADLADTAALNMIVRHVRPQKVAHLAAISFVAHDDVAAIYATNVVGTRNLLQALAQSKVLLESVLLVSSANIYGNTRGGMLNETTAPAPANDYAVSKLAMEYVAHLYATRLPIVITRPFNYTGVGQADSFLIPKIISHARRHAPYIELGNLDVARDFSDVRTVVQLYQRLLDTPAAVGQTFNVCSGKAWTLSEVLAMVQQLSGHCLDVRVNPAFVRANEVQTLLGSRAKLDAAVGVAPELTLQDTLRWMLQQ